MTSETEVRARFPEHDKLLALDGRNIVVGEFLEWLGEKGYVICDWDPEAVPVEQYMPMHRTISSWIAEYFDINPARIEEEKRQMLVEIRQSQGLDEEGLPAHTGQVNVEEGTATAATKE